MRMMLFHKQGTTAFELGKLVESLQSERIDSKCNQLDSFNEQNPLLCSMVRVQPRDVDSFSKLEWLPASMKSASVFPENTSSFAAPWVLRISASSARFGAEVWPCPGLGAFVVQSQGPALFFLWPIAWTASINVGYDESWAYLSSLPAKEFEMFWGEAVFHCALHPTEVLWIPYGWAAVMVSMEPTGKDSKALLVRMASTPMLSTTPRPVLKTMLASMDNILAAPELSDPIRKYAPAYREWVAAALNAASEDRPEAHGSDDDALGSASVAPKRSTPADAHPEDSADATSVPGQPLFKRTRRSDCQ